MPWYALQSKPSKEEALWRQVAARGYEAFYPYVRVMPVNPRARKLRPYFPGYIFVRVNDISAGMNLFSWVPYAQGLVGFDREPAPVPDELLGAILQRVDEINAPADQGFCRQSKRASSFNEGDKVVINDGPFAGYQAMFDAHRPGTDRVRVLLQFLRSRPMRLDLPAAQIELINRRRRTV